MPVLRRYGGKWAKNRQIMRKCCLKFTFFAGQCLDWRNAAFIQTFPNILRTNEKAREALAELKKLYGQDEMSLVLENDSGSLVIPKNPIADYVDYASEGEGKWSLVTEGENGGKKKHSSEKAAISVTLPIPTQEEIYNEGQLELETGQPAPGRESGDASLIAQVVLESESLARDD